MKTTHTKSRRRRIRGQDGSISAVFLVLFVVAGIMISCFGFDLAHNVLVRSELQSAADAAALAGAYDICYSGGSGAITPTPGAAPMYYAIANQDSLDVAKRNRADGGQVQEEHIEVYPGQLGLPPVNPNNGYSPNFYTTVTIEKPIFNLLATLIGRPIDNIRVTAVAGPIGSPGGATSAPTPFPFAIYLPHDQAGPHSWKQEAGLETLDVGILPLLTNKSTSQFVSGPTGLLGGTLATVGAGGNGYPTIEVMHHFDPDYCPPRCRRVRPCHTTCGQNVFLLNPGVTGLNLTPLQAGPLAVENYFQCGRVDRTFLGLLAEAPSCEHKLARFLQGKTFVVPVVACTNSHILAMPLHSILRGGVVGKVVGFRTVQFTAGYAQPRTGLGLLDISVIPPDFIVEGKVGPDNLPINIGLVQ